MAVTIVRTPWIDDDGSGTTGTVLNNAIKTELYNQIDGALALLSGNTTITAPLTISGMPDATGGLILSGLTTNRPTVDFRNAASGILVQLQADNQKGFTVATNAGGSYAISAFASGGVYIGGPTPLDPGANRLTVGGAITANGILSALGVPDAIGGLVLSAVTTGRPTIELKNATAGSLVSINGTNNKDLQIFTNAGGIYAAALTSTGLFQLPAYTATTFVAGDKYLVVDAAGNVHRSAVGPAS